MKKTILALLISICLSVTATAPISALAEPAFANFDGAGTSGLKKIEEIESILDKKGTSVSFELNKQIERYRELAKNAQGQELARLNCLIEGLTRLIENHQKVNGATVTKAQTKEASRGEKKKKELADKEDVLQSAIASVISFFTTCNYLLSAELLTQMYVNDSLDSTYYPLNADRTLRSSAVSEIKNREVSVGTGAFENEGSEIQRDNYFSLHKFRYVKTKNGTLVITDRYDYSKSDNFGAIQNVPIQMMYEAQELGLLTPYYVVIVDSPEGGVEDFSSDYLSMTKNVVHIYNSADSEKCCVNTCNHTRSVCYHTDENEDSVCELCNGIVGSEFVCVDSPLIKEEDVENLVGGVSGFFQNLFSKISKGWNSFVEALKNLFKFS